MHCGRIRFLVGVRSLHDCWLTLVVTGFRGNSTAPGFIVPDDALRLFRHLPDRAAFRRPHLHGWLF